MKPILGIFLGEAAGIGPEVIAALVHQGRIQKHCRPLLIGDARVLEMGRRIACADFPYTIVDTPSEVDWNGPIPLLDLKNFDPANLCMGQIDTASGKATGDSLITCMDLLKTGGIEGFVFGPLNKEAFKKGGHHVEDEHFLFAQCLDWLKKPRGLLNVLNDLWVFRVTGHIPFKDVAAQITHENVTRSIELSWNTLRMAGYENPRIALAALNPHAGDGGTCGQEEVDVLIPVIENLRAKGMQIVGPIPADTIFMHAFKGEYDSVVTLYHDQGQIATKLKAFEVGVTVSGGMPYAITTPEHGTAFDIAGKNIANPTATEEAVRIAAAMAATGRASA